MKALCATENIKYDKENRAGEQTSVPVRMNRALHQEDGVRICVLIPFKETKQNKAMQNKIQEI